MQRYQESCSLFRQKVEANIRASDYGIVVISGGWAQYDKDPRFRDDLRRTVRSIAGLGKRVVIIGQMPWMKNYNRECDLRAARVGLGSCEFRMSIEDVGLSDIEDGLGGLADSNQRVSYLSAREAICKNGVCTPYIDGRPVYYDKSHISMSGSWALGRAPWVGTNREAWSAALTSTMSMPIPASPESVEQLGPVESKFVPRSLPVVLGGYRPDFPYHVRSQRGLDSQQGGSAAMLEYWDVDETQV
ncbi:SGNH hydrolase domain-containing protein [uncultured Stenotrophomonas sp.]|uniref:SGNH hydrolase domain-containing protein n=1 Tax=uncultured Stenotrophomonas sp. TaxID=165438 RepID=UPI0025FB2776|nr:SGNH hydrolase domain-containing protein [uncultured Stenotrophomonas sp.]